MSAGEALGGRLGPVRSLYIHVPFCFHKCHYCDFYSFVDSKDQQGAFVERLLEELAALAPHGAGAPLRTIFVGGGTPSLLRPELWRRVLGRLGELFDLSAIRRRGEGAGEFTVECNPETVTSELAEVLAGGGVNRVSVGAQSFNPRHLKTLERWHEPENVARALETARRAGIERLSLDLIFAIPGQTLGEWEADLFTAASIGTSHISCYNLTYEANTAMTQRLKMGEFEPLDEDIEAEMHAMTVGHLARRGLARYEVSNFAQPGQESLHNLAYWRNEEWLAAGPSASGHVGGWRWKNVARLPDYLESSGVFGGYSPAVDVEGPDAARAVRERIMMGVRLAEGLAGAEILAAAEGARPGSGAALMEKVRECGAQGWLEDEGGRWRLSGAGFLMADRVAAELMACV